jgi:hypothetical protein
MVERTGIAIQILGVLSETHVPGLTRGEIRDRLGLPADTEITARVRELRDRPSYGLFKIKVDRDRGKEYRYYMLPDERARAKQFLVTWKSKGSVAA